MKIINFATAVAKLGEGLGIELLLAKLIKYYT
jgi:hypothetical protein